MLGLPISKTTRLTRLLSAASRSSSRLLWQTCGFVTFVIPKESTPKLQLSPSLTIFANVLVAYTLLDMVSLTIQMSQYYEGMPDIPEYIFMVEDA
jgi:hypothetical protein